MPLVRISLRDGKSPEYRRAIADGIHRAMVEALAVPEQDRFQLGRQAWTHLAHRPRLFMGMG